MGDHIHGAQTFGAGCEKFSNAGGKVECIHILAEGTLNTGAQNLDGDVLTGLCQAGAMDLRDGSRSDRFGKFRENLIDRAAQFLGDLCHGDFAREGGEFVLQDTQLPRHILANHVGAGREHLTEFNVGGSQRSDRAGCRWHGWVALVA